MSKKAHVDSEWTTYSYSHLYNGAYVLLEQAEKQEAGSFYLRLSAMVMCAFAIEAHMNHLGPMVVERWDTAVQKGLSVENKFKILSSVLRLPDEVHAALLDHINQIVRFRNKAAHATTESRRFKTDTAKNRGLPTAPPEWERNCTRGTAKRYKDWTKEIIQTLNRHAGISEWELYTAGESFFSEAHGV
jgi:hypothetical protein